MRIDDITVKITKQNEIILCHLKTMYDTKTFIFTHYNSFRHTHTMGTFTQISRVTRHAGKSWIIR